MVKTYKSSIFLKESCIYVMQTKDSDAFFTLSVYLSLWANIFVIWVIHSGNVSLLHIHQ